MQFLAQRAKGDFVQGFLYFAMIFEEYTEKRLHFLSGYGIMVWGCVGAHPTPV
jgi:hypothetical protein